MPQLIVPRRGASVLEHQKTSDVFLQIRMKKQVEKYEVGHTCCLVSRTKASCNKVGNWSAAAGNKSRDMCQPATRPTCKLKDDIIF